MIIIKESFSRKNRIDMKNGLSLFIFRRDLRLVDNTGLNEALRSSSHVLPCFFLDPRQLNNNPYRSESSVKFMQDSLEDLCGAFKGKGARLYFFDGSPESLLPDMISRLKIKAVFFNRDYTPFSLQRDKVLKSICDRNGIDCIISDDALINPPEKTVKKDGSPYSMFTPYFRNASLFDGSVPIRGSMSNFWTKNVPGTIKDWRVLLKHGKTTTIKGGRSEGLKLLSKLNFQQKYETTKDLPVLKTSLLSAHNKFGTLSIREVYHAIRKRLGVGHPLLRQLYWRDFFTAIAFFFPPVFGSPFHEKYSSVKWMDDSDAFKRRCRGRQVFPLLMRVCGN